MTTNIKAYRAAILHSLADPAVVGVEQSYEYFEDGILLIENGKVAQVGAAAELLPKLAGVDVQHYRDALITPGFIDTHIHYPQTGMIASYGEQLLDWLNTYTFPTERQFEDKAHASDVAAIFLKELLRNGTTTALVFGTVHPQSVDAFFEQADKLNLRMIVGKVLMDDPASCPDYYRDPSAEVAIDETRSVINHIRALPDNDRVLPVITPRFIPSCTDAALAGLGALAAECGCHVQTHCSESDWAHGYAIERYGKTDTAALDGFGLLTRQTVLAHSVFLTDDDMATVKARGAGVAHCALSNMYFANAVFPLRRALDAGLHVGLGTDISGGPSASMLEACRTTVQAARLLADGVNPDDSRETRGVPGSRVDMLTAFHLATAGGGIALNLDIGVFRPGYHFDALIIDPAAEAGTIRLFGGEASERIEQILYTASRPNIVATYVGGDLVAAIPKNAAPLPQS